MKPPHINKTLLIVNADDFGESKEVNLGIIEAHRNGLVTSASLMANMPAFTHALTCSKENPGLNIGVHLNVHRGTSLTSCPHIAPAGKFLKSPAKLLLTYLKNPHAVREEITKEFDAQIEMIKQAGVHISHLDTEKHLHTFPFFFTIVLRLAEKHAISFVRLPYERASLSALINPTQWIKTLVMTFCAPINAHALKKSPVRSTDYFFGVTLSKRFTVKNLEHFFAYLPPGTSELSCHPGYEPKSGENYIDAHRTQELATLTDPKLKEFIEKKGIVLSHFSGIS